MENVRPRFLLLRRLTPSALGGLRQSDSRNEFRARLSSEALAMNPSAELNSFRSGSGKLRMHLIRLVAAVMAITAAPVAAETQFEEAARPALSEIQRCSSDPVAVLAEPSNTILIYRVQPGVLDCLGLEPGIYPSPYGDEACGENCRPMPWAAVKTNNSAAIVSAAGSDWGASAVTHVRPGIFIATVQMATHARNFLVRFDTDEVIYLTDGRLEVKDAERLTFAVKKRKSFFRPGGAFWYSALIDRDGHILDVLPENGTTCLSRDEMVRRTHLDLSRVKRATICFIR